MENPCFCPVMSAQTCSSRILRVAAGGSSIKGQPWQHSGFDGSLDSKALSQKSINQQCCKALSVFTNTTLLLLFGTTLLLPQGLPLTVILASRNSFWISFCLSGGFLHRNLEETWFLFFHGMFSQSLPSYPSPLSPHLFTFTLFLLCTAFGLKCQVFMKGFIIIPVFIPYFCLPQIFILLFLWWPSLLYFCLLYLK